MPAPRGVAVTLVPLLVSLAVVSTAATSLCAAAAVAWPPSTGLVIGELVTGGDSASDEFVEIYNAAAEPADLGGRELVYVTASGATTTRKAIFATPLVLAPGQNLLVANSAGAYAPGADATYTGGLAADGGTLVLRSLDGTVLDAVGWGSAANAFVEVAAASAPPARASLERRPGGSAGNWTDTNDNAADWQVQLNPTPESMAAPARPAPTPTASLAPPTADLTAQASASATTPASEQPAEPTAEATAATTIDPTAPAQSGQPGVSIATARARAVGTRVHVRGIVTAAPGVLGAVDLFAVSDSTAGIFVRLPEWPADLLVGRTIELTGTLSAPYGQLELREVEAFVTGAMDTDPEPTSARIADVGEGLEGALVTVAGAVDSVSVDGLRLVVVLVDGQNSLRVLADPAAGIARSDLARGDLVALTGIVGQRATALSRADGYRLWLRRPEDLAAVADPSPSVPASGGPRATPAPSVARTARPTRTPTPTILYRDLATALAVRGRLVDVEAVVTAAAGIVDWGGPTIVVDDGTAAAAVVLPAGAESPRIGARVRVAGKVGSLHSGMRVVATSVAVLGDGALPAPLPVAGALGPAQEWRLVQVCGHIERLTRAGSRWRVDLQVSGKTVGVLGEPGALIPATGLTKGRLALVTGIVRRSTSDSSAFALLPRSTRDLWLGPAPATPGSAAGAQAGGAAVGGSFAWISPGTGSPSPDAPLVAIADLATHEGTPVTVAGIVADVAPAGTSLEDGTGTVRLGGPLAADALALLEPGDAIEVAGLVARNVEGLLIEVDPDRIVALAGPDLDNGPSPSATAASGTRPSPACTADQGRAPATPRGDAQNLTYPPPGLDGTDRLIAIAVAGVLALVLLAGLTVARFGLRRRIRRLQRPAIHRRHRS
jgi:hypothetical protein